MKRHKSVRPERFPDMRSFGCEKTTTCQRKAQRHRILKSVIPACCKISVNSLFVNARRTERGASFFTILDLENKAVSPFMA